jgi:hypothetical protein
MVDPALLAEDVRRREEEQQRQSQAAQKSQGVDGGALADVAGMTLDVGVEGVTQAVEDYVEPRTFRTVSDSVLGRGSDGWTSTPMDVSDPLPTDTAGTVADVTAGAAKAAPDVSEAAAAAGSDLAGAVGNAVLDGLGSVVEGLFSWG